MDIVAEFESIADALSRDCLEHAVCGGFAVNLHGHIRATRDIDLLIRRESLPGVLAAVRPLGYILEAGPIPFGVGTANERELYRVSKPAGRSLLTLDLLLVTPVFEEVWRTRAHFTWRGREVSAVSLAGLEIMKRLAGRAQDRADLEALGLSGESPDGPTT